MKRLICVVLVLILLMPVNVSALADSAKAAIIINADTLEVIYSHNQETKLPMASTTKIMTALLLCEHGDFEREITVTAEMLRVEGSSMGLLAGDKVTLHDLLYGLLLASGNDAANVVAFTLGKTINGFVKMMNQRAKELGLENTNFVTPSGLDAEGHYTTAYDLARLAATAIKNEAFAAAAASKTATLNYGNPPYRRTLTNHNKLLNSFDGAIGVKTGFTKKSGRCLVSAAKRDGKTVIAVTLNDPNDWQSHKQMLEYGFSVLKENIFGVDESYIVPVISGTSDILKVNIEPFSVYSLDDKGYEVEINLPDFVYAPIKKNQKIGSVIYKKNGQIIGKADICAKTDIKVKTAKLSFFDSIKKNILYIFRGMWEK